jgi:hypothetical protein
MLGVGIKVKDSFGKFLGGFARVLRGKGEDLQRESRGGGLPAPASEEEEALYAAMGWDDASGNAAEVAAGKVADAVRG